MKKRVWKLLCNLDLVLAGIVVVALILLTFCGVIRRYVFRDPITWMEEVQMILFMWVTFLSAGAAFRTGGHIAIEIVVDSLPAKAKRFFERFDFLIQFIILGYLCIQGITYYNQMIVTNRVTTLLRIPFSIAYAAVPVGCVLMIVCMVITEIKKWIDEKREEKV